MFMETTAKSERNRLSQMVHNLPFAEQDALAKGINNRVLVLAERYELETAGMNDSQKEQKLMAILLESGPSLIKSYIQAVEAHPKR